MRRLLLLMDGSQASQAALASVEVMGEGEELEVVLLGIAEAIRHAPGTPVALCVEDALGRYLAKAESRLRAQGIAVRRLVLFGKPENAWKVAELENAEMFAPQCSLETMRCEWPRPRWCPGADSDCPLRKG